MKPVSNEAEIGSGLTLEDLRPKEELEFGRQRASNSLEFSRPALAKVALGEPAKKQRKTTTSPGGNNSVLANPPPKREEVPNAGEFSCAYR